MRSDQLQPQGRTSTAIKTEMMKRLPEAKQPLFPFYIFKCKMNFHGINEKENETPYGVCVANYIIIDGPTHLYYVLLLYSGGAE